MIMPRPPYEVIEIDYDRDEVWYETVDAENMVRKFVFKTRDLEVWMITTGHDHMPMHSFTEKWIFGRTISDAVLLAFLKRMMPEYQFRLEKTTSL